MFDLTGQKALVTGASRGIGQEIAEALARAGAEVWLASRSQDRNRELADAIRSQGMKAHPVQLDVGDSQQVRNTLPELLKEMSELHILVNNAGITRDQLLLRMKDDDWRQVFQTNLDGPFYVTREVMRVMMRKRYGRIINITSVVGQMGNPGQTNYAASKAGMVGFTKSLAREVASRGITVNAIAPGYIETEMTESLSEKSRQELFKIIPLGRIGSVEDVAFGVRFLASKEAGYITGHVLNINGGMYM